MHCMKSLLLILAGVLVTATHTSGQKVYMERVGEVLLRVLDQYLSDCNVILMTTEIQSSLVSVINK